VSENVFKGNGESKPNRRGLTDFVTYWGQFIDHDFGLTGGPRGSATPAQHMDIPVPAGDAYFDPNRWGNQTIPVSRSIYDIATGTSAANPRQQVNLVTAWHDASQVYGSDSATADYLRQHTGGLLKTMDIDGLEYPMFNDGGVVMENAAHFANDTDLFIFGDVRGNENPGLTSLQILFVREHNRKATDLAVDNPTWTDEQLYQEARRFVIALIQHITEEEYLAVTLGEHFEEYEAYRPETSPDIFTEFSTGAFRYGHSEVNSYLWRLDSGLQHIAQGPLRLKDHYFNSRSAITSAGIEPILRGMAQQVQGEVDTIFVEDLRNYLFGNPGRGGFDLTALNTQRGRDHGLPGFNAFRVAFGLAPYNTWSEINPNPDVWQALARTYESVDDCDVYVCGLAEVPDSVLSNLDKHSRQ